MHLIQNGRLVTILLQFFVHCDVDIFYGLSIRLCVSMLIYFASLQIRSGHQEYRAHKKQIHII